MSDTVPGTALVDAIGDGVFRLDADGRVREVNDALLTLTGHARADLHDAHVSTLFGSQARNRLEDTDGEDVDVAIQTADSGQIPCEVRVTAMDDGRVGVVRERPTAEDGEDDVETPPDPVSNVIEQADIGVFVLDSENRVAWADTTVGRYFGLDRCAVIGRDKREVIRDEIVDRVENGEAVAEALLTSYDEATYPDQLECHVTPGEGREERWLENHSEPIESGEYAGGRIELYYDVTDRKRSEGSLRDAEERFRSLVDAVEEYAIFRLDTDGTVISWNEGARSIKGYEAEEIVGQHFSAFYTEEDRADGVPQANLDAAYRNGSVEDEGWRVRQDGSQFWANVTITAVHGEDGSHKGYLKVTRDLTDRHLRERELETELEQMLGRISDAFYAVDDEFRFTHVNERAEQLLGYSSEELEGTVMWKVLPEGPGLYGEFQHALTRQEPTSFERYFEPLGIWAELNVYPSETGLSVYLRDVTERKERERELRRTERRFEAMFEDPNILAGLLSPDGTVLDINETAMEYIDADLTDVQGEDFWETPWWGTDEAVRADVEEWTERAAEGEYVDFETDITGPDDGTNTISGFFRPVVDDDGEVVSIVVSDRDVTERKERERDLELFRNLLDQSNDALLISDPETGSIHDVNDTTVERLGYSEEELLEMTIPDIETELHGLGEWQSFVDDLRAEGQTTFDGTHQRKDGSTFPVEVEVSHVEFDQEYVLSIARDVTERRERERQLEQSEQRYRTLVENFPNGIVTLFDHDLQYELAAGQGFDGIPVDQEGLQGKHFRDVWDEETVETLEPAFQAALDGEEQSVELEYAGREWMFRAVPITDEAGEVFAGMTMAQDITERKERERYLEDVKSRLEAATEAGAVGTWEWDIRTDEMVVGESFAETFGIDPRAAREGVSLDRFIDSIHEDDRERAEREVQAAVDNCGEYESEYRVRNADGEYRWVVARGHVECENGEAARFVGALTDITERKRAELELQRNNGELEALFEVLPVGVIVAEADGELVSANDTAREIWGGEIFDADSIQEYEQFPIYWADSGEQVPPGEMTLTRVLEGETVTEPELFEIEATDGSRRIVEAKGRPIYGDSGEVVRGVVTMSDVTERHETQRKLRESERRYRTLVESFPDGSVAMFDEDLEYTAVGGQLVDEVGVDRETRIGRPVEELYPDDIADEVIPHFEAALAGETNTFELDFHDRHLQATTLPVRDADGDIFAGMLVVQNVTERYEYERKLEESNERLEQFAYSASHDLQEPLRMISSYLQLIEERYGDVLDEDGEEFLEFAVDGADRMKAMIEGLLAYSRVETRGDPLEPTDLDSVLADVRTDLQLRIDETGAEIRADSLPTVVGDENQLRQVFQNLVENAIEYSGDEAPTIHIDAERVDDRWRIDIHDEGIGIDPEDQERIFEVFQRLHTHQAHEGTGIGLSLVERIVERHDGDIWVDSEPGEGTTFSFTLPAVEE